MMFAFQSAHQVPLHGRRVRRLAPLALCGFPLSFFLLCVSPSPGLGTSVGLALGVACLALTLVIAMTGTNQVAGGLESRFDEFELNARLRGHSDAYRWFSGSPDTARFHRAGSLPVPCARIRATNKAFPKTLAMADPACLAENTAPGSGGFFAAEEAAFRRALHLSQSRH